MSKASCFRAPHPTGLPAFRVVLFLGLASGCGGSDPRDRQAISGVVTLDGRGLDDGAILLEPLDADGRGLAVGGTIRRGAFAIPREQGPAPGSYRVRVYSSAGVETPPGRGQTERTRRPMVERIPEIYNTRSEWQIVIVAGRLNRLRLDMKSGGGDGSGRPGGSRR